MRVFRGNSTLKENKIVLLIDNIDFSLENQNKLIKFKRFFDSYPNVRIICTCLQLQIGQIPIDFTKSEYYVQFKLLYLKYYKSKQITELTERWYSRVDMPNKKDKIDRIIKLLLLLKLPRTPLAISMFLWIFEKQEEYQPINQSTMLENFVEKLFKKHSKEETYYNEFNYRNKESLLSAIAKKMYFDSKDNYSIKYSELLDFVVNHLKTRQFDFNAEHILKQFFYIGLLTKTIINNEPIIKFRFNCFFQYFLMKNMEKPEFYNYIMEDSHYLSFIDEIDYFTGMKQNRVDILNEVISRMEKLFKNLKNEINKVPGGIDSFFNVKSSITEQLENDSFMENLKCKKDNYKKEVEDIRDKMLETIKPKEVIEKKTFSLSIFNQLERSWLLAAKILRNTEETEDKSTKFNSYVSILECSLYFLCLYKFLFIEYLKTKKDLSDDQKEQSHITLRILPIIHETILSDVLSSTKLNLVLKNHLDSIKNKKDVSELERLISLLFYSDSKGKQYEKYLMEFIKSIKNKYIYDNLLLKIISYYFLRSDNANSDLIYENLIAEIIIKPKKLKKKRKSEIMLNFRKKRDKESKHIN